MSTPMDISETIHVEASPAAVWSLISDVRRMPEFSPELRRVFTPGGSTGVGARIIGINRRGLAAWPTTARIVRWEPERAIAWKVRESGATWLYEVRPSDEETGSSLTARRLLAQFTAATALMGPAIGGAAGHDRELSAGLVTTLERMKAQIES